MTGRLVGLVLEQAAACAALGSGLYAALLRRVAVDVREGGPCAVVFAGYEDAARDDVVALRLLAGVHAAVLAGRAPQLAECYPSVGGVLDPSRPDACWPAFRSVVATQGPWLREWLTRPPQTNEVGRAAALLAGLLVARQGAALPVRLFELGCSAGLNLRFDRFRFESAGGGWGPVDSPVVLSDVWRGPAPAWWSAAVRADPGFEVVQRRGCDVDPVEVGSPAGRLALRAYVWPDQVARAQRLAAALRVAQRVPARVDRVGAARFLAGVRVRAGTLTVVWHSVMRQYVPAAQWARVSVELDRLAGQSSPGAPFVHVWFEPGAAGEQHRFQVWVRVGAAAPLLLADAHPHGLPAWSVPDGWAG